MPDIRPRVHDRSGKIAKRKSERDQSRWNEIDYGAAESKYKRQITRAAEARRDVE